MKFFYFFWLSFLLVLSLNPLVAQGTGQYFTEKSNDFGILAASSSSDYWGSGVSFFDFNQDGWDDLSFALENDTQAFYLNTQNGFQKVNLGVYSPGSSKQLLWLDYDNDGDFDLLMSVKEGWCYLYRNEGNLVFTDVTIAAGFYQGNAANYGVSASDYDKDGFLDIFVCRYNMNLPVPAPYNVLYRNLGNGSFQDVSAQAGFNNLTELSFMGVWLDYDKDTWPDLYVINDRSSGNNRLYRNNANGTFSDLGQIAGVGMNGEDPMTASVADFDNDQDLDIYTTNTSVYFAYLPKLYVNQNNGTFLEQASFYGVNFNKTSWGGLWLDYDNDTKQDLYVATSFLNNAAPPVRNYFFKNQFPNPFLEDSSVFIGNHVAKSHAVARGDFDNNGFYDIIVHNDRPGHPFLWNNSGNSNSFVKISLEGTISNRMAIGSWIHVFANGEQYTQYLHCGENYIGQNSQYHIFGLANALLIDSIHIVYLSGIVDRYYNLAVNQTYHFVEGESLQFEITYSGNTKLCNGDSIILSAPQFASYQWNNGNITQEIVVANSGFYWLEAFNQDGFLYRSDTIEIQFFALNSIEVQEVNVSCNGLSDASIVLSVNNDGQAYNITWQDGSLGNNLFNLPSGTYSYNYMDEVNCSFQDSVQIEQPFPLSLQSLVTDEREDSLGSIQLVVSGGSFPYQIYVNQTLQNEALDSLEAGIYHIEVLDEHFCALYDTLMVNYIEDSTVNFLNAIKVDPSFVLLPNPVRHSFAIQSEFDINELSIFNVTGDLLKMVKESFDEVNVAFLSSGLYYIKLRINETDYWIKMQKL